MSNNVAVLAVMEELAGKIWRADDSDPILALADEARAAVAELIEVASQFVNYKSSDFGDTSILDNEDLWDRLSSILSRVRGAA